MAASGIAAGMCQAAAFAAAGGFCAVLSWTGANPIAPLPLAVLAAAYWASGRPRFAQAAIACAVAIGWLVTLRVQAGAFYALFVLSGVAVGFGMRRAWSFGRLVAAFTAITFGTFAVFVAFHTTWNGWKGQAATAYEALEAQMRASSDAPAEQETVLEFFRWMLLEHWGDVSIGLMFASFLVSAVLTVGITAFWVRLRHGLPGPGTPFVRMRPPEWLVWLAIACALLWFAEQRMQNDALRAVVWNGAIGLAAIYWLNGLSIVLYAVRQLQPHAFVILALMLFMMYAGGWLLSFVGLFDTWWELRAKVDRAVAAREKVRGDTGDDK